MPASLAGYSHKVYLAGTLYLLDNADVFVLLVGIVASRAVLSFFREAAVPRKTARIRRNLVGSLLPGRRK